MNTHKGCKHNNKRNSKRNRKRRKNNRATGAWRRLHSKRILFNLVAQQLLRDGCISSYLFFSVNLSPSPLISSMKLSLVTAILHETVQQLFFLLPNEVQPRLLPPHSAEQGLHLPDRLHPSSGESLQTFFIGTRLLA
ncbi:hypothetical protein CY35_11G002500 [Sphagnum magellanicum]|nr:hypothetical protein CY35_11G002500 [Sphagnum magellanicum]